jgi:AraC family transcriptional regulator of adaptative response/methylated-DNA-[protein]-cysteine methyltransferase
MIQSATKSRAATTKDAARVTEACRIIEQKIATAERVPALAALARRVGLSAYHFHRLFKRVTGLTPRDYAAARREQRLRAGLGSSASVTEAIADAGYASSSRFYEKAGSVLGMQPKRYRAGGVREDIRFAIGQCSLGAILVAQSAQGVCAILLGDDPDALLKELQDGFPRANLIGADKPFEKQVAQVVGFVEAPRIGLKLPLDIRGTAFQRRVWRALQKIPPGKTASYTEIARRIGAPQSVRAVAGACAANTLAVAIPCHRVVRNDGALSGYRWGVERKGVLLGKESGSGKTSK